MSPWIHGSMDPRIHRSMDPWIRCVCGFAQGRLSTVRRNPLLSESDRRGFSPDITNAPHLRLLAADGGRWGGGGTGIHPRTSRQGGTEGPPRPLDRETLWYHYACSSQACFCIPLTLLCSTHLLQRWLLKQSPLQKRRPLQKRSLLRRRFKEEGALHK